MDGLKATMDKVKCERGRGVGRGDHENIIVYVWFMNSIRTMQRMSGCEVCRESYLGDICHGWMNAAQTPTYTSQKRSNASVAVKNSLGIQNVTGKSTRCSIYRLFSIQLSDLQEFNGSNESNDMT